MNPYEGLNLADLIALMHELVVPAPVSWLPQTPGWWIVLGWLMAVLLLGVWRLVVHRRRNRYRRDALAELKIIEGQSQLSPQESAQHIAALIKRTALVAWPRNDVASLYGSDWARFLTKSANDDKQVAAAAERLATAAYQSDADGRTLAAPARRWIRRHHA